MMTWWLLPALLLHFIHPASQLVSSPCDSRLNCTSSETQPAPHPVQSLKKRAETSASGTKGNFKPKSIHLFTTYSYINNTFTNESRGGASSLLQTVRDALSENSDESWDDSFEFIDTNETNLPSDDTNGTDVNTIPRETGQVGTYFLTTVYIIILLISVVANATVGFVILTNGHLRTSTYYHLLSLSFAELVLSVVGIPTNIGWLWDESFWPEGQASCVILDALFEAANFASVLNVVCVSAEVYVLICRPHIAKVWVNEIHAKMAVAAVWFVCVCSSVGVTFCIRQYWEADDSNITSVSHANMSRGLHEQGPPASPPDNMAPLSTRPRTGCLETLPFYTDKFNLLSIAGLYVSVMVLLAVLYVSMFTRLKNTTGKMAKNQAALRKKCESMTSITAAPDEIADGGQQDSTADQPDSFTPTRPVTMLGTVVAIVCLCRMFYYVICILSTISPRMLNSPQFEDLGEYVTMATRVVFYLSGVLVPAVYVGMSVQFRRGLKWTCKRLVLCRWRDRKRRRAKVLKGRLPPAAAASNQTVDTAAYNSEDDLDDFDMD
ncbi:neuromedin-U receptor 2-like [Branchiostoma lanceolatum]|uniref:neuromedin-U receptor 2-like n=1 Tax=Branchiostoma lanceolatum TaxID=7740 RepID=UPI0034523593